jgi:hypothetical protein
MGLFLHTTVSFLFAGSLLAAQNIQPGQVHELATFAPAGGAAEQISSAINDQGDVYLSWQAAVHPTGHALEDLRRVEGAFLRRTSTTTWKVFPTMILGEADAAALGATQVYAGGDHCSAPDVIAVGNQFMVTWGRKDASGAADARLECALIEENGAGDAIVHSDGAGVGYLIEDGLDPSLGNLMPAMAAMPDGSLAAAVVYVNHLLSTPATGGILHDFDLRGTTISFASIGVAPSATASESLDSLLAFDQATGTSIEADAVMPDCAFDPFGNLVVSYEDWRTDFRLGLGWNSRGRLEVGRYALTAGDYSLVNNNVMFVREFANMQRHSTLHRSPSNDEVSLSWLEVDPGDGTTEVAHFDLDYPDAVSAPTLTDFAVGLTSNWFPEYPQVLQQHNARAVIVTLDFPSFGNAMAFKRAPGPWTNISKTNGIGPNRAALGHLEVDPNQTNRGWLAIGSEGLNGADVRCFVMMTPL